MEILDKRKVDAEGNAKPEPETHFDRFVPTVVGCHAVFDTVLLRELILPEDSAIATPDAFKEPCLYAEVIDSGSYQAGNGELIFAPVLKGDVVRILRGIGTTIDLDDADPGHRYFTVHAQDILCKWSWK